MRVPVAQLALIMNNSSFFLLCIRNSMSMITLREHAMIHAMNDITDKPGWEDKVKA